MEEDQGSGSRQQDEEKMALILQKEGCVPLARSQFEKLILKPSHTRQGTDSGSKMPLDTSRSTLQMEARRGPQEVMWLQGSLYYHFPNRQDATPEEDWDHLLVRSGKDKNRERQYT